MSLQPLAVWVIVAAMLTACGAASDAENNAPTDASGLSLSSSSNTSDTSSSTVTVSSAITSASSSNSSLADDVVMNKLRALSPAILPAPPADISNAYADNPPAAELGKKFFFDPRFSGPLLNSDNTGASGTLGRVGETGKIACEGCHNASSGLFADTRSPRGELSLAASWTRRRTPSLLDVSQHKILNWDGRHDAMYNQVFGVIESPLEFNSSRLFVAQQIIHFYKAEYEAVFGPMPSLAQYDTIAAANAGCEVLIEGPTPEPCLKPGNDDPDVLRILVNFGKAIGAFQRQLSCGPSRFDKWIQGDEEALSADEKAGAAVFVNAGCDRCHSGPFLTDNQFYNLGVFNGLNTFFVQPFTDDPGAAVGIANAESDILNTQGQYSDGDDGRLNTLPNTDNLLGAFKTPGLRCVGRNASFFHAAVKRSLEDVVVFFNRGGDTTGYQGVKNAMMTPLNLTPDERNQLVAFLRGALNGEGADAALREAPVLPQD